MNQVGSFTETRQMEAIYDEGSESLELAVHSDWEHPIILTVQRQAGQGFEQLDLVNNGLAHGGKVGLGDL